MTVAIPTVEIGDRIIIQKITAIIAPIKTGCNVVTLAIATPSKPVAVFTNGRMYNQSYLVLKYLKLELIE